MQKPQQKKTGIDYVEIFRLRFPADHLCRAEYRILFKNFQLIFGKDIWGCLLPGDRALFGFESFESSVRFSLETWSGERPLGFVLKEDRELPLDEKDPRDKFIYNIVLRPYPILVCQATNYHPLRTHINIYMIGKQKEVKSFADMVKEQSSMTSSSYGVHGYNFNFKRHWHLGTWKQEGRPLTKKEISALEKILEKHKIKEFFIEEK